MVAQSEIETTRHGGCLKDANASLGGGRILQPAHRPRPFLRRATPAKI